MAGNSIRIGDDDLEDLGLEEPLRLDGWLEQVRDAVGEVEQNI